MKLENNKICVLQFHHTDLMPLIDEYNCVQKIKFSGIFDHIVLAAADINENRCLREYAEKWEIDLCFGSVDNVHERISSIINDYNADIILRALPQWYFIDIELIRNMIEHMTSNQVDYLPFKKNFDFRFAGDLFTRHLFEEIDQVFAHDPEIKSQFKFNPWGFADLNRKKLNSKIIDFNDVPIYPAKDFSAFKETYNKVWPEHWDNSETPLYPYKLASQFINESDDVKVLDIACGFGTGSVHLSKSGATNVTGVDISKEAILHCQSKYPDIENICFMEGDSLNLAFEEESFDLIVSIHTMEHVVDDELFLKNLQKWLRPGGKIVLEVPLLMKYPFAESAEPYGDAHIREYESNSLCELFSRYFELIDAFGVSRGFYCSLNNARNAILVTGRRS